MFAVAVWTGWLFAALSMLLGVAGQKLATPVQDRK